MRRRSGTGVAALIAALGVAGCGGSVDTNSSVGSGGKGGAATGGAPSGGGGSPSSGGSGAGGAGGGGGGSDAGGGSGGVSSSCEGLDDATCQAQPGCRADHCPCPGVVGYVGCYPIDAPPTPCPASCPAFPCDDLTTLTGCQSRPDCHAVFMPGACGCAACCCTFFNHCTDGGTADCKGPALCAQPAPDCTNPDCNGAYALSYLNGCYDGCVLTQQCAP